MSRTTFISKVLKADPPVQCVRLPKNSLERHSSSQHHRLWLFLTLCGTAAYLYLRLFNFGMTPFLLSGDQVTFWMEGMRMLDGEQIYRDFFRFIPPGTDYLYAAVFSLFGARVWVTNLVDLALGVGLAWLCFSISAKLMKDHLACLTTALYSVFVYGKSPNGTHHFFAVLAIAGALNVLMGGISRARLAIAGILFAVAAFFNQVHGATALVGVSLFLVWRHVHTRGRPAEFIRNLASLLLGFAPAFFLLNAYPIGTVGLKQLWYCQVIYVWKFKAYSPGMWSFGLLGPLSEPLTPMSLLKSVPYLSILVLLPPVFCVAFWLCWSQRNNSSFPWERFTLLTVVGSLLLAEITVAVTWFRVFTVSLFGVILFVWMLAQTPRLMRYAFTLGWVLVLGLAAEQLIAVHTSNSVKAEFPGGYFATSPQEYDELHWIERLTKPGDPFLEVDWTGVYLPLRLKNPLYVASLDPWDAPRVEDIELAIQQIESKKVRYILREKTVDWWCGLGHPCPVTIAYFQTYLQTAFTCQHTFPNGDTLWRKDN